MTALGNLNNGEVRESRNGEALTVWILGHSGFVTRDGDPDKWFTTILARNLNAEYPDRRIELRPRPWTFISQEFVTQIAEEIRSEKPDYLLLAPIQTWVTFPVMSATLARRLPAPLQPAFKRLLRTDYQLTRGLQHRHQWMLNLYKRPMNILGGVFLRPEPRLTVQEAVGVVDRLLSVALQTERTEVVLIGGYTLEGFLGAMEARNPAIVSRLVPTRNITRLEAFINEIVALAKRRHVPIVDHWTIPAYDLMSDGFHSGPITHEAECRLVLEAMRGLQMGAAPRRD